MSKEYDKYLENHITGVSRAFLWIEQNLPEVINETRLDISELLSQIHEHDYSKYATGEYKEYDDYFYGERTEQVERDFARAWNHHQKCNKHHWQYWVLINDDYNDPVAIEMPLNYIIEMICDWWAFSWTKNNLMEIFDFYESHKTNMILHENTRAKVEEILNKIKLILQSQEIANDEIL